MATERPRKAGSARKGDTRRDRSTPPPSGDAGGRLLFAGPPDGLRASVPVANSTAERLPVRRLIFRRPGNPDVQVRLAAVLPPGASGEIPVRVALPADTAPGTFEGEIEFAGQVRPIIARIDPTPAQRLAPARVLAGPGATPVSLVAQNTGNVELILARRTRARLVADAGRVTRPADDGGGPDATLLLDATVRLAPGTSAALSGRVEVPDGLDPTRRYEAELPVGLADLTVVVLARDEPS